MNDRTRPDRGVFGPLLRSARLAAKRTLAQASAVVGMTASYLSDVENGRRVPLKHDRIETIAATFKVDPIPLHLAAARDVGQVVMPVDGMDDQWVVDLIKVRRKQAADPTDHRPARLLAPPAGTFMPGTVIVFEPKNLNPDYWNKLSENERYKYYSGLGYGVAGLKLFVFVCEVRNAPGHCIIVDLREGRVKTMQDIAVFREITEDEI